MLTIPNEIAADGESDKNGSPFDTDMNEKKKKNKKLNKNTPTNLKKERNRKITLHTEFVLFDKKKKKMI